MLVQFESGPHLYRSVIILSVSVRVRGRTYIDRPSPCHVSLVSGAAPTSIGHVPITFHVHFVSGPHLYQSVIILSVSVRVRTAPISIGHSSCQFELGPHLYRSAIFLSSPCQFDSGPHLYRSTMFLSLFVFSLSQNRTYIDQSSILSISV